MEPVARYATPILAGSRIVVAARSTVYAFAPR
jgi:hypothetical protein